MGTFEDWVHSGRLMAVKEKDLPPNPARAGRFLEKVLAADPVRRWLARPRRVNREAVSIIPPPSDTIPAKAALKRGRGKPRRDLRDMGGWLKLTREGGYSLREISRDLEEAWGVKASPATLCRYFRGKKGG